MRALGIRNLPKDVTCNAAVTSCFVRFLPHGKKLKLNLGTESRFNLRIALRLENIP